MKKLLAGLISLFILIISIEPVFAKENNKKDTSNTFESDKGIKDEFEEMFRFDNSKEISINGVRNNMFIEFDSQEDALLKIRSRCFNILNRIKEEYNLEDLTDNNWQSYKDGLYSILDDVGEEEENLESDYEYRFLRAFFDIYENKYKNDKVYELSSGDLSSSVKYNGEVLNKSEIIAHNLPYYSAFSREYFDKLNAENSSRFDISKKVGETKNVGLRASMNVNEAVNYAIKYADEPNTPQYYYFNNGDCANFISQILERSGIRQEKYESVHSGWWHTYNPNALWNKHTHSRSWTMADTFSRYMGVILTRTNHKDFSSKVYSGKIIAADWENDGDWEHLGFVTEADNYVGSYGYYDYRVAQHTKNYHRWTSNSGNNWEKIGIDGGRYGRIRH